MRRCLCRIGCFSVALCLAPISCAPENAADSSVLPTWQPPQQQTDPPPSTLPQPPLSAETLQVVLVAANAEVLLGAPHLPAGGSSAPDTAPSDPPAESTVTGQSVVDADVTPDAAAAAAAVAVADLVRGLDPLRALMEVPADFSAGAPMGFDSAPGLHLSGECPAVAAIAGESGGWALAIDYAFMPISGAAAPPCQSGAGRDEEVHGVLGLVHPAGGPTRIVAENYARGATAYAISGEVVATGEAVTGLAFSGDMEISTAAWSMSGAMSLSIPEAEVMLLGSGATQLVTSVGMLGIELAGIRASPGVTDSHVPSQGVVRFVHEDAEVEVLFQSTSPATGELSIRVNGAPPAPLIVPGLIGL